MKKLVMATPQYGTVYQRYSFLVVSIVILLYNTNQTLNNKQLDCFIIMVSQSSVTVLMNTQSVCVRVYEQGGGGYLMQ